MNNLTNESEVPFIIIDIPTRNQLNNLTKDQKRQNLMRKLSNEIGTKYYSLFEFYPDNWLNLFIKKSTYP